MSLTVKHAFVSGKPASADPNIVDGPKWNADHTITGTADTANITDKAVTFGKIQDIPGVSVVARDVNSSGVAGALAAGSDDTVLRRTAAALSFGQLTPGMFPNTLLDTDTTLVANSDSRIASQKATKSYVDNSIAGAGTASATPPQGRLTLQTGVPVMITSQTGKTTIFYSPYNGQLVPLYNGSAFVMSDIGGELSQATTDNTKSPAAVTTNSNYDLFVWNDGGTFRCTRGPAWSSDTARGTGAGTSELVMVKGILLNANAITNGPSAQRGTYVGTVRSNGSSQIDWSLGGASAGGTAAILGVWNMYNRVTVTPLVQDSSNNYTYNSTTIRALNNSNGNRISFIRGLDEDGVTATLQVPVSTSTGDYSCAISLDSTSALAGGTFGYGSFGSNTCPYVVTYNGLPGLGWHFLQNIEKQITTTAAATIFTKFSSNTIQGHQYSAIARA